jgi:photosystem II stability/assembly factor-like uncharacterized protein
MNLLKTTHLNFVSPFVLAGFLFCNGLIIVRAQSRSFALQIISLTDEAEARSSIAELKQRGIEAYLVKSEVPGKGTRYRVRVGKFANQLEAKSTGDKLAASGSIKEFAVMAYEPPTAVPVASRQLQQESASRSLVGLEKSAAKKPLPAISEVSTSKPKSAEVPSPPNTLKTSPMVSTLSAKPSSSGDQIRVKPEEDKAKAKPDVGLEATNPTGKPTDVSPEPASLTAKLEAADKFAANRPAVELAASVEPKIAAPPIADALTDASFANNNWKIVRRSAETDKNLRTIHFVDAMTGWAAGDAGALYRTTDGGRTWKPLLSGVSANINFIHFLDWNHGWMIGEGIRKDEGGTETLLLSTINGGRTWMIQKTPNLLSIYFTDLQNGWAVGRNATLLHTTNGGNDWKPVEEIQRVVGLPVESSNYNFGFRDVYFLDADHGWLIGNFYGRTQNNIGGLFATADGGKTWNRLPLTLKTQHVSGRFTPGLLHSVHFTDLDNGSITGEMQDGESRYFFALHTRDGGKTWEQFRTPTRATHSTQFLDLANGWMAAFAPREGSAEAVVYDTILMRTDNGGMSWQNDFTAKGSRLRSVFFLSPNKGWAVGDRGMILRYEEKSKAMN